MDTARRGFARQQLVEEVEVALASGVHLVTGTVSLWCEPDDEMVNLEAEGAKISFAIDPEGEEVELGDAGATAARAALEAHALASEWVARQALDDAVDQGHRFRTATQSY